MKATQQMEDAQQMSGTEQVWWGKVKNFIGLADEVGEAYEEPEDKPAEEGTVPRNTRANKIVGMPSSQTNHEVLVIEPKTFEESLTVVAALRSRKACILNLVGMESDQAQRLVDFVSGATHALDGHQQRIGDAIFLFTPVQMTISTLSSDSQWFDRDARDLFWRVK